jgi:hypothetical protein
MSKHKVPPKKNPNGRFKGATLVFSPDRDAVDRAVPRMIDAASGRPLWKWLLRTREHGCKNLYCADWRGSQATASR